MTDIGVTSELASHGWTIPSRLGTNAEITPAGVVGTLTRYPTTMVAGALRMAAVVFLVDAVAGITLDTDPDAWSFTSDLSVRFPAVAAPETIVATAVVLREGRRSATAAVPLCLGDGTPFGIGLSGFARVPRRPDDPPKPSIDLSHLGELWAGIPPLDLPLREATGIRVLDASRGEVELVLRPDLANPAGALQGALVSLVAEVAAEELAGAVLGSPQVVTEIDIRYLAQARTGPVRSRSRLIGPPTDGSVLVDLLDAGLDGKHLATVTLRTRPAPTRGA